MTFAQWFAKRKFETQQKCADEIGLHKSTVSRMLKDPNYRPDRTTALYIQSVTGGKVSLNDWFQGAA